MHSLKHPSTIIATLALIVALGGSAYASGLINGSQIRNGTITGSKIHSGTITANKLAPAVRARLYVNPRFYNVVSSPVSTGPLSSVGAAAFCLGSDQAVAAGYSFTAGSFTNQIVTSAYVNPTTRSAQVVFGNFNSTSAMFGAVAQVTCERAP
jgi:hypothetical protein